MTCAWQELLAILPPRIADAVDRQGRETAQEIRLRRGSCPEIRCGIESFWLQDTVRQEDMDFCVNVASRYSPWSAQTAEFGYITAPGGHRIGICGEAVIKEGRMTGIRGITSLCIRVARDFPGIGKDAASLKGSVLIIGPPGSGKTTLLRDLIRQISVREHVGVVDERQELFPMLFSGGQMLNVLKGCPKAEGIDILLRTMGPECIAVDEITASRDCDALRHAGWCGVRLLATAHAGSVEDLKTRPLYRPLLEAKVFDHVLVLKKDKSWKEERIYT